LICFGFRHAGPARLMGEPETRENRVETRVFAQSGHQESA
jgi:hypothetical protein